MQIARIAGRIVINVGVPLQREPALILIARADRPAAQDRVREPVPCGAPLLPAAEREIEDSAEGRAVGAVVWRDPILQNAVARIEEVEAIRFVRACVTGDERAVTGEAVLYENRSSLVMVGAAVLFSSDANRARIGHGAVVRACEELWIRPQKLPSSDCCAIERRTRQQALKRIRDVLTEERLVDRIPNPRRRQVLQRKTVEISRDRQMLSVRVEIVTFDFPTGADVALRAELPARVVRRLPMRRNDCPERQTETGRGAQRRTG